MTTDAGRASTTVVRVPTSVERLDTRPVSGSTVTTAL